MIEVEEKFELTKEAYEKIKSCCKFIKKEEHHDLYFDFSGYTLTTKDIYLRTRNGKLELKYPIKVAGHFNYKEYDKEEEIYKKLNLKYQIGDNFEQVIEKNGLNIVMDFKSVREKYKSGRFTIDIDNTNFGFGLFEVETMVENEDEVEVAEKEIDQFIQKHGIVTRHRHSGKGVVYLQKFNPEYLQILIDAGVVKPDQY